MILACKNISKSFGVTQILHNISFHIEKQDSVGLVGVNGAGKTTLFRIIGNVLKPDTGQIIVSSNVKIGYLSQQPHFSSNRTLIDEMLHTKQNILELEQQMRNTELKMKNADDNLLNQLMDKYDSLLVTYEKNKGYSYKSEVNGILKNLGFVDSDLTKPINSFSGGQKTRIALAQQLLKKPDVLLLDEPTNHLDMSSISWLENYLQNYEGTLLIISHDRYFLNKIVNKIVELENGANNVYIGNYSEYANQKSIERSIHLKHYINQQKEIHRQEEVIKKLRAFNREKSIKRATSRENQLNKIDKIDKPISFKTDMNLVLEPRIQSGKDVLQLENVKKSFDKLLFENVNFSLIKGEKIALIGDNGTGKTTLFKLILKELEADSGIIKLGMNVKCGYYDQEHTKLNENNNLIEEISDSYPTLKVSEIRDVLASFLFTGDDVFKRVCQLSGGEKGRLSLAKLMLSEANFLLLDEPTNHLDMISKEVLENALNNYTGSVLYISHDRYFINQTADRILELTNNGITNYLGNYDYYVEKKQQLSYSNTKSAVDTTQKQDSSQKNSWLINKAEQAKERKRLNSLKKIEEQILETEKQINYINQKLCDEIIYTDYIKLNDLTQQKKELELILEDLYLTWEMLT